MIDEEILLMEVIERAGSLVIVDDPSGKIKLFNRKAGGITCHGTEEVPGKHWTETFVSPKYHAVMQGVFDSLSTGNPVSRNDENLIPGKEGRELSIVRKFKKELLEEYSFHGILTRCKAFREKLEILPDIAGSDSTVLITGESGTGKEVVATALHNLSCRKNKALVKVDCGAIPESLLESEFFGYKKGAFTDAREDKAGLFKAAEGGTIFLDEIGNLSRSAQAKLLRVLEAREYKPLGGTCMEAADVRIISATNRDLRPLVESGEFRADLYYRLKVFAFHIPALRERPEDIPLLLDQFLLHFNKTKGRNVAGFTQPALDILINYDYPGNVRELKSVIEHAFICPGNSHIRPEGLPPGLTGEAVPEEPGNRRKVVKEFERQLIKKTLIKHRGSIKRAAEEMGIHRATLWRKLRSS